MLRCLLQGITYGEGEPSGAEERCYLRPRISPDKRKTWFSFSIWGCCVVTRRSIVLHERTNANHTPSSRYVRTFDRYFFITVRSGSAFWVRAGGTLRLFWRSGQRSPGESVACATTTLFEPCPGLAGLPFPD